MIWSIYVVVDESKCLNISIWEFSKIWEHLPFWPWYKRILRLLLVHRNLAIWRWYPWLLQLSSVMLIDPFSVNIAYDPESSSTISPRSTTRPLYLWYWGTNSEFFRWQRSINDAKWTFLPYSLLPSSINSFLFMTFDSCHAWIFSNFPMLFSLHPQHLIFFNAWGIGRNLCTKF